MFDTETLPTSFWSVLDTIFEGRKKVADILPSRFAYFVGRGRGSDSELAAVVYTIEDNNYCVMFNDKYERGVNTETEALVSQAKKVDALAQHPGRGPLVEDLKCSPIPPNVRDAVIATLSAVIAEANPSHPNEYPVLKIA